MKFGYIFSPDLLKKIFRFFSLFLSADEDGVIIFFPNLLTILISRFNLIFFFNIWFFGGWRKCMVVEEGCFAIP
jgi:hypothetical protein